MKFSTLVKEGLFQDFNSWLISPVRTNSYKKELKPLKLFKKIL